MSVFLNHRLQTRFGALDRLGRLLLNVFLYLLMEQSLQEEMTLHQCNGWHWDRPNKTKWWNFPNKIWAQRKLSNNYNTNKLNRWWGTQELLEQWRKRWTKIWSGWMLLRVRIFIWRLMHQGCFANGLASKWGVCNGSCKRCHLGLENIKHLFFNCIKDRSRWHKLKTLLQNTQTLKYLDGNFFESIQVAPKRHKKNPGPLVLLVELCSVNWNKRNAQVYAQFLGKLSSWWYWRTLMTVSTQCWSHATQSRGQGNYGEFLRSSVSSWDCGRTEKCHRPWPWMIQMHNHMLEDGGVWGQDKGHNPGNRWYSDSNRLRIGERTPMTTRLNTPLIS